MAQHEQYRQGAFNLAPQDHPAPDALDVPAIDRDAAVLPNRRLPNDFWPEFLFEWRFREQHGLPPVSPREFAAMRDRSDGVSWSVPDWAIGGAYGPSAGYDGDEESFPEAPRGERAVFDARRAKLDATI